MERSIRKEMDASVKTVLDSIRVHGATSVPSDALALELLKLFYLAKDDRSVDR